MDRYKSFDNPVNKKDSGCTMKIDDEDDTSSTTFRVDTRLGRTFYQKYVKLKNVIPWLLILLLVLIAILMAGFTISAFNKNAGATNVTNETQEQDPSKIVVLLVFGKRGNDELWTLNVETNVSSLLFNASGRINAFEIFDEKVIWSELNSTKIFLRRFNDKEVDVLFEDPRVKPRSMAIDDSTGNLYLIDQSMGTLIVVNVITKEHALISADLVEPSRILLDSSEGVLFIYQNYSILTRFYLDGSGQYEFKIGLTHVMALDTYTKRIYWLEDFSYLVSSDYCGQHFKKVDKLPRGNHLYGMSAMNDTYHLLYVSGPIHTYNLKDNVCSYNCTPSVTKLDSNITFAYLMRSYRTLDRGENFNNNSCSTDNGGCQDLCLLNPHKSRSCACSMGWQLNDDLTSCSKVQEFVLYTIDKTIRARSLDFDRNVSVDVIWPTSFKIESLEDRDTVMFEYDTRIDEFYFIDDYSIYRMKLMDYQAQSVIYNVKNHSSSLFIASMAYDWLSRNIYYVLNYSHKWSIFYFNVDAGAENQRSLTDHLHEHMLTPFDLVVYPSRGYMFYKTGYDIDQLYVQRAFLNGSKVSTIGQINYFPRNKLVAIDYDDNRAYWISDVTAPTVTIKHAQFDGSDERTIEVQLPYVRDVKSIYVHGEWVYLSTYATVARVDKKSGRDVVKVLPEAINWNLSAVSDSDKIRVDGVQIISASLRSRTEG